jgi:hypothetical protein
MFSLILLLACGEKSTDTGTAEDTGITDTGDTEETAETGEAAETGETTDTGETTETGETELSEASFLELTENGGCSDYFVYIRNEEDTISLSIQGSGLAAQAHEDGSVEVSYDFESNTSSLPSLMLQRGSLLNTNSCDDVFEDEPIVEESLEAISGTMVLRVEPEGEATDWGEFPAVMDVTLTNVCFSGTETLCLGSMGFASFIGWMPGK